MKPLFMSLKGLLCILLLLAGLPRPVTAQVSSFEYYFDTDPGFGNGVAVTSGFIPGDTVGFTLSAPVTGLSGGFHQLFVRPKTSAGRWGHSYSRPLYIGTVSTGNGNLTGVEYFFDTDPGLGNGTFIALSPAPVLTQTIAVPVNGLSAGFHQLYLRTKNTSNNWSHYQTRAFYITTFNAATASNITGLEYFFDTDPGNGNGTPMPLTAASTISQNILIPVTGVSPGFHQLFIRAKNGSNTWSHYQTRPFVVTSVAGTNRKIAGAEYFIDVDPGNGNGTPLVINPPVDTANQTFALTLPSGIADGPHNVTIRVKNEQGQWSLYQTSTFAVKPPRPGSGYALSFDGSNDYIALSDRAVPVAGDFTVDFWVFNRSNSGYREFISQGSGGDAFYIGLNSSGTGAIRCGEAWQATGATLPINQWVHVALIKSGTNATLYLNGIQAATTTGYSISAAGDNTMIGRLYGGNNEFPDATIDEIRIWSTALTQTQIRDRMCRKITSGDALYSNLIHYYNFDENFGTTLYDDKGSIYGALTNGPAWILSGAPIGNVSAHSYSGSSATTSLTNPLRGDGTTATLTSGGSDGIQVYWVTDTPNNVTGTTCLGNNNGYFAAFAINGSTPTYDLLYNYSGIYLNALNESQIKLYKRSDNSSSPWMDAAALVDTTNNTLAISETARGEYIVSNAVVAPTIVISANPNGPICAGTSVTFTAAITNGGTTPAYQWKVNNVNAGTNNATFTSSTLTNGDVVTCELTSNSTCVAPATVTSPGITMTVTTGLTASVSISANPGNSICAGTQVMFTATPVNGGPTPTYQWKLNGTPSGGNAATYTSNTLSNGDVVTCNMSTSASCAGPATVTSTGITMTVTPLVAPTISISSGTGTTACSGANVTFTATITNGGANPAYQWKKNGNNVGANSASYSDNALNNNDAITCTLTSDANCATPANVGSNSITMTINSSAAPTVSISNNTGNTVCAGTAVTFSASITNGGATPSYQWKKNNVNVGTNSPAYTDNTLANNDEITCVLTSSNSCATPLTATSNTIDMTVNPYLTPGVSISANPGSTACSGAAITFTATPTNGGPSPSYQWKKNNVAVGSNSATYTDNTLASGDVVTCVLTSNYACPSPLTATSVGITMTINPLPTLSAGADQTILQGSSVVLTATGSNNYLWSTSDTSASIIVSPSATTTYTVSTTNGFGCTASDDVTVTVNFSSVAVSPNSYNFGDVVTNFSASTNITVTNNGTLAVTINSASISGTFSTSFSSQSLAPNNSLTIPVTFSPTGTLIYQQPLSISTSIGSFTVIMQGRGVSPAPAWTVSPSTFNFGNVPVGDSLSHVFFVNNTGNIPIALSSITSNNIVFAGGTTASTIGVGSQAPFQVKLKPTAITSYTGVISLNTTTAGLSSVQAIVSGNGYVPATPPVLQYVTAAPYNGTSGVDFTVAPAGTFTWNVVYKSADGKAPMAGFPKVGIDLNADGDFIDAGEGLYSMNHVGTGTNWVGGETYTYAQNLSIGNTYGYRFSAKDSLGNIATAVNTGYVAGPLVTNQSLDLSIYANDITFSNNTPGVGQQFTVSAVVHNNSPFSASNVPIRFYKDSVFLTSTVLSSIGANSTATISQNFTFSPDGFYPIKVWIDSEQTLTENNRLNNYAIRPVIVGHFTVPGAITTTHTSVTQSCPTSVFISGVATYSGLNLVGNPPVLGGTVTVQITGGPTLTTHTVGGGYWSVYANNFNCGQNYSYTVTVTDFTLTGTTSSATFNAPCIPCDIPIVFCPGSSSGVGPCLLETMPFNYNTLLSFSCFPDTVYNDTVRVYADNVLAYTHTTTWVAPNTSLPYADAFTLAAGGHVLSYTHIFYDSAGQHVTTHSDAINVEQNVPDLVLGVFSQTGATSFNVRDIDPTCVSAGAHKVFLYDSTSGNAYQLLDSFAVAGVGAQNFQLLTYNKPGWAMGYHYLRLVTDVHNTVAERVETNNVLEAVLYVPFPELTITNITPSATNITTNSLINFSATVSNTGSVAGAFKVQFLAHGVPIGNKISLSGLNANSSTLVVSDAYTVPTPPEGCPVTIQAIVDVDAQVAELLESNNTDSMQLGVDLISGAQCDAVGSFCNPYVVVKNMLHRYNSVVTNIGSRDISDVHVRFSLGNTSIGSDNIVSIPAHSAQGTGLFYNFVNSGNYVITLLPDSGNVVCEINETNNPGAIYVNVVDGLPDLEIFSQHISPSNLNPNPNQTVTVVASVFNKGNQTSAPCIVRFSVDSVQLGADIMLDSIPPNGDTTVAATVTYSSSTVGPKIIKVFADANETMTELVENNNVATRAIIVGGAPDLSHSIYEAITLSPTTFRNGDSIRIRNYIRNYGGDQGTAWLKYTVKDSNGAVVFLDSVQFNLQSNDSARISKAWAVNMVGAGVVYTEIVHSTPQEFNVLNNTDTLVFTAGPKLQIALATDDSIRCVGERLSLHSTISKDLQSVSYQWFHNAGGTAVTLPDSFALSSVAAADAGSYLLKGTDYFGTVSSAPINVVVNPLLIPTVSVSANPGNQICAGTSVQFTATPVNGGTAATYQWKKNNNNVGTNQATYTDNNLANSDIVTCTLTSNASCTSQQPVSSNSITMAVTPIPTVYNVTGGGSYCSSGTGVAVGLDNSEVGVSYQLYDATLNPVGSPVVSSAVGPITFGNQTAGTYTVKATSGACTSNMTGSAIVTVSSNNTVSLTSAGGTDAQAKCINTAITPITYSTTGATGATITGLPAGVSGNWAGNVVTISGTPTTTVGSPFTYTVTLIGGCGNVTTTGSITVTPDNTATLSSAIGTDNQTATVNTPITTITYATTGATGATVTGLPSGVSGSWSSGVVTINGTPTATTGSPFTYTVTLTGGCGSITAAGTITVISNTSANTVTLTSAPATAAQTKCINTAITPITYATTGATGAIFSGLPTGVSGNWAGNTITISGTPSVPGPFNYTVTLTGGSNSGTANGTIVVHPLPVATITPSSANAFCNATTLSAVPANVGSTYVWTYNSNPFATTQSIGLRVSDTDGIYTLRITDNTGCVSLPVTYNYQKQNLISSYNIYALRKVDLYSYNTVTNGSIGVNNSIGQLFMQANASVNSTGVFVKAPYMSIYAPSTVPNKIYAMASGVATPSMNYSVPATTGSNTTVSVNNTVLTGNYYDVTIGTGLTVTLDGNSFHSIVIGKNSKVIFTAPVINAYSISTSSGAKLAFNQNTEVRVARSVRLGMTNKVNPLGKVVTFYVGDNNSADEFKVDEGGLIIANAIVPDLGTITIGSSITNPTTLYGLYLGYTVSSTGKNVSWNSYDCTAPPTFSARGEDVEEVAIESLSTPFDVRVSPNPSSNVFTFNIISQSSEPATLRIMDISGRVILSKTISDPGLPIEVGTEMAPGNYFAEIIQAQNKKVLKLTKLQ